MKKSKTKYGIELETVNWQLPYMLNCHEFKNKRILVVHSYECAFMASINNSVVYVTDDKEKYKKFVDKVVNSIQFENDYSAVLIKSNQWLDLIEILEGKGFNTKFDVAVMNPPYNGDLHLKILEKIIPIADNVMNISPVYKKSDYNKFEESISKKIENIEVIDAKTANEMFGTMIDTDLGIYTCSNTMKEYV